MFQAVHKNGRSYNNLSLVTLDVLALPNIKTE